MSKEQLRLNDFRSVGEEQLSDEIPVGYKKTDVGVLPFDWDTKRLGELFDITSSKRVFQSEWKTQGIPFYRARELAILAERGKVENQLFISKEMYETYRRVNGVPKVGDVLITGVGTLGKLFVVSDNHEFYFKDGNIIWLKSSGLVDSHFLKQLFKTKIIMRQIVDSSAGTTVGTYTIVGAKKTIVPFPPISEQHAIAEVLTDVDNLIESLDNLISKKQAIKNATMQQLLTGRTRLPGFNGGWETRRLGELVELISSGTYGVDSQGKTLIGMPVVTTSHIDADDSWNNKNMVTRYFTESQVAKYAPQEGDLIVVKSSGSASSIQSGKIGFVDANRSGSFIFSNFLMLLRPTDCNALFLFFQLTSSRVKRKLPELVEASTYPNIRLDDYLNIDIFLPSKEEQQAISSILLDMDAEIEALERQRDKMKQIKQGMMQQLLTGRIRLLDKEAV